MSKRRVPGLAFLRKLFHGPAGALMAAGLMALLVAALFGPLLLADKAELVNVTEARQGMSAQHWFGTDDLGRDVFARVVVATRLTMQLVLAALAIVMVLGYGLGLLAALSPPLVRRGFQSFLTLILAFPPIVLALFVGALLGQGTASAMIAVACAFTPLFARTMVNLARPVGQRDYVHAVRMLGVGPLQRLGRHILPNISAPLWIQTTAGLSEAMIAFSALSFLGLGVQLPAYDWGTMLADSLDRMYTTPSVVVGPALAITLTGILFVYLGEAGARAMDPVRWSSGRRDAEEPVVTEVISPVKPAVGESDNPAFLTVRGLQVAFPGLKIIQDLDFHVGHGETLGIVGESGSGKSMTALAIMGLAPYQASISARVMDFDGIDLVGAGPDVYRRKVKTAIAMVFQSPLSSLTPTMRIGEQLMEGMLYHSCVSRQEARLRALKALDEVRLSDPEKIMGMYPHQLSGGMRQRVVIAMALTGKVRLLIADEPTTALDVTIQRQILDLLEDLKARVGLSTIFISHDLGVVSDICDRVLVMYRGKIVEELVRDRFHLARHPYTRLLLSSAPAFHDSHGGCAAVGGGAADVGA